MNACHRRLGLWLGHPEEVYGWPVVGWRRYQSVDLDLFRQLSLSAISLYVIYFFFSKSNLNPSGTPS